MQNPQLSAGYALDTSFEAGRFNNNHRPRHNNFKQPLPFADLVTEYFHEHRNEYLEIHYGDRAFRQVEWDANDYIRNGGKLSLHLSDCCDFSVYWWPVKNLTIVLSWNSSDTVKQIGFANYLSRVCKAHCVYTIIKDDKHPNGVDTKFQDTRRLS